MTDLSVPRFPLCPLLLILLMEDGVWLLLWWTVGFASPSVSATVALGTEAAGLLPCRAIALAFLGHKCPCQSFKLYIVSSVWWPFWSHTTRLGAGHKREFVIMFILVSQTENHLQSLFTFWVFHFPGFNLTNSILVFNEAFSSKKNLWRNVTYSQSVSGHINPVMHISLGNSKNTKLI